MTSKDQDAYDFENALYAQVADEIETGKINKGLWAKAIATASGDKSTIEANYITLRVENLLYEISKSAKEDEERKAKIVAEEARAAKEAKKPSGTEELNPFSILIGILILFFTAITIITTLAN